MDINSHKLVDNVDDLPKEFKKYFTNVPDNMIDDANDVLSGKHEVTVDSSTKSGRKLLDWAAEKRKQRRKRNKSKEARKARRKSRRK